MMIAALLPKRGERLYAVGGLQHLVLPVTEVAGDHHSLTERVLDDEDLLTWHRKH